MLLSVLAYSIVHLAFWGVGLLVDLSLYVVRSG